MNNHHRINYVELQATDFEAIKTFYSTVFGWKFTDFGPDYTAFNDGTMDGGFAKGEVRAKESPLIILYSDELEASLDAVEKNGGAIVKPIFSFPGGRRFHFTDPAGNELAIWSEK